MVSLFLLACSTPPPTFGPVSSHGTPTLDIPLTSEACEAAGLRPDCAPSIDAQTGDIGFFLVARRGEELRPLRLRSGDVRVLHDQSIQPETLSMVGEPIPSAPVALLVDPAVLNAEVLEAIRTTPAEPGRRFVVHSLVPGSSPSPVLETPAAVADALAALEPGEVDLYAAVAERTSTDPVQGDGDPVVLVLYGGFPGTGTCADNLEPLERTLSVLSAAHRDHGLELNTLGVGKRYRNAEATGTPSEQALCGPVAATSVTELGESGVDHLSLGWMARATRGVSYIRHTPEGVAQALFEVAEPSYTAYGVGYTIPDVAMAKTVQTIELELISAGASVTLPVQHP